MPNYPYSYYMIPLAELWLAVTICQLLHLGIMALIAHRFGIPIRKFSYGVGPTLLKRGVWQIRILPISGYVTLKDSRAEQLDPADCSDAFNHQSVWKQVFLPLAGGGSVVLLAVLLLGEHGWESFLQGFDQIFEGAISPFSTAQLYLEEFVSYSRNNSFPFVLALVASKFGALNFLPFVPFCGGQVVMNLVRWGRPGTEWEAPSGRSALFISMLILAGWLLAFLYFVVQHSGDLYGSVP